MTDSNSIGEFENAAILEIEIQESEIEAIYDTDALDEICLYSVVLQVQAREFKGQVSGLTKCALTVNCNSLDEFKHQTWLKIKDKLKREVVFDESNNPQWHDNISPEEEDMDRFVLFYDTKSKRSVTLAKTNTVMLSHWRSKEIWLYIHMYSTSVSNLTLWRKVQKVLIEPLKRDRAGASTISEMNIQASQPHLRERLINSPPPADMLHLFALAKTTADDRIVEIRQNLCVAENVNEGMSSGLARIRSLVDGVREMQKTIVQLQNEQQAKIEVLIHELTTMETQASTTKSLLNSMEQAVPATETSFGRELFQNIQDHEDVDHM